MPRFSRLVAVLWTKKAARPRMMAATTTWKMIPRMNSLCQNEEDGLRATVSRAVIEQTLRDDAKRLGAPDPSSGSDAPFWPLYRGQRMGGAYCSPPLFHNSFRPRARPSGVFRPTLRSKLSP